MDRIVVVGASLAGLRAVQAIRGSGFDGEVIVVGEERHHPYTRPPLSKQLLLGTQSASQCELPWRSLVAQWLLGARAAGLDRARKTVHLSDGADVGYDRLIVATGVHARRWPGPGQSLDGVHTLRTLEDAAALSKALRPGLRLVIVGAGFIGCEVAASARRLGIEVTMLCRDPHPLLPLGPLLGRWCAELHRRHGVDLRCGCEVKALRGDTTIEHVELADGRRLEAEAVVIGMGGVPSSEWLGESGIALDPGVVCDATLTTREDPDVLAAGDIASFPHPGAEGEMVRIEHWTTAAELGLLAGRNVLLDHAARTAHESLPYVWSDQYDVKIQAVGFADRAERFEVAESAADGSRFVALGVRGDEVIAAVAVNAAKRLSWYRRQLAQRHSLDALREVVLADATALGPPQPDLPLEAVA